MEEGIPVAWKPIHDGAQMLGRLTVKDVPEALEAAAFLIRIRPEGTYPWRVEIQKSIRGARATVTVCVQVTGRAIPPYADRKRR